MGALLNQTKESLIIDTKDGELKSENQDIIKNLFKVCSAILNMRPQQRGHNPLQNNILKSYLFQIREGDASTRDNRIIDQLWMIKGLVNRPAFSLTDAQVSLIYRKLHNLSMDRKNSLYSRRKSANLDKVYEQMTPSFSPKTNKRSKYIIENSQTASKYLYKNRTRQNLALTSQSHGNK